MDNALLHASGHSPEHKIEERITFTSSNACLYLSESYDELDDKSAAVNTFDISYAGGGSISLLSDITVSLSSTSGVACCLIFTSYLFLPKYPIPNNYMVD